MCNVISKGYRDGVKFRGSVDWFREIGHTFWSGHLDVMRKFGNII